MESKIENILKVGTLLSTAMLVLSVVIQIFARFFLENTPPWTEETSRLFFIYATAFAAGLALKEKYYVHLDLFFDRLPRSVQRFLRVLIPSLVLSLFALLSFFSIFFILQGHVEYSPSMKIRMSFVFASMFILGASISYYALIEIIVRVKELKN